MGQPLAALLGVSPRKPSAAPPPPGVNPAVVLDIASTPCAVGRLDLERVRLDRPLQLQRRRVDFYHDEEEEGLLEGDGGLVAVFHSASGSSWELGCFEKDNVFQIILDVLTNTLGACRITAVRVRDGLGAVQCVKDGLRLLECLPEGRGSVGGLGRRRFFHPVTGEAIEILGAGE